MQKKILSLTLCSLLLGTMPNHVNATIDLNKVALVGGIGGAAVSAATLYLCYKRSKALKARLDGRKGSAALLLDQEEREQLKQKLWWYNFGIGASGAALLTSVGAAAIGAYNLYKEDDKNPDDEDGSGKKNKLTIMYKKNGFAFYNTEGTKLEIRKRKGNGAKLVYIKDELNKEIECLKEVKEFECMKVFREEIKDIINEKITDPNSESGRQQKLIQDLLSENENLIFKATEKFKSNKFSELKQHEKDLLAIAYRAVRTIPVGNWGCKSPWPQPKREKKE
jgi:hypothetical protein